jgi:hypothetical protein
LYEELYDGLYNKVLSSGQDFAEAIAQLAMFPPGREALLLDPTVAEALRQVAAEGWTAEAQAFAESALLALSDRQPDAGQAQPDHARLSQHIMVSYQWDVQPIIRRVVNELQVRVAQADTVIWTESDSNGSKITV